MTGFAKILEAKEREHEIASKYVDHEDELDLALSHPTEFAELIDYLKKKAKGTTQAASVPAKRGPGRPPKNPEEAKAPKKRGGHDKETYPDGQYWGKEGKPKSAAECTKRLETEQSARKISAYKKLLESFREGADAETSEKYSRGQNGSWGKEGKPADIDDALKRHRKHGNPPRIKKMLENVINEYLRLGFQPSPENARGIKAFNKTAAAEVVNMPAPQEEGAGDSEESPKSAEA